MATDTAADTPAPSAPGEAPRVTAFTSPSELRAVHARLLELRRTESDSPAFLDQVSEFIAHGAATGALVDGEDERRVIQSLLDYWANVLDRAGRESPDPSLADFDMSLAPELPDAPCPYLGLQAFGESDSAFYFGREALVESMVTVLGKSRLLAVIGSSGSGKSSVVFAGLLPALKSGIGKGWRYVTMVPGTNPMGNLDRAWGPLEAPADRPTLLVVDQFEETFTLNDDGRRSAFIDRLIAIIEAPDREDRVVLTMRSDFVDNVAKLPSFQPLFERSQVDVKALGINELRAAIEKPAERVGLKFEAGIVDDLISTILGERAGLPLLQFTLLKLWENRQRNRITMEVYQRVGNPRQALERSAEAFFTSLIPEEQTTARNILLRMVRPGEGREVTSNRIPLADVFRVGEDKGRVERVLGRLIFEERLVKLTGAGERQMATTLASLAESSASDGEVPQVEVAHEALVRNWPRLVAWLDAERVALRERLLFAETARRWKDTGRDPGALLRGRNLEDAERYADLTGVELDFVQKSRAAADEEVAAKERARQRELELAQLREQEARRVATRLRTLAALLTVLAVAAACMAAYAVYSSIQAGNSAARAERSQATAEAAKSTAEADRALAKAAEGVSLNQKATAEAAQSTAERDRAVAVTAEAESRKLRATAEAAKGLAEINEQESRSRESAANAINQFGSDALAGLRSAVTAIGITRTAEANTALRRALAIPQPARILDLRATHADAEPRAASYSPDGKRYITLGARLPVHVWDAASGELLFALDDALASVNSAQFSPDGARIVTAHADGTAHVWDAADGTRVNSPLLGHAAAVNSASFSPDGARIVTASDDGTARLWDATTFTEVISPLVGAGAAWSAEFSPDGRRVVVVGDDGTARIWSVAEGVAREEQGLAHPDRIYSAHFSPDGSTVLTAGADGNAYLWNLQSADGAAARVALRGHDDRVRSASFSPDGNRIVTASDDGTARVWDADSARELSTLAGHKAEVLGAAFNADGRSVITASNDGTVRVWDIQPVPEEHVLAAGGSALAGAEFSPDDARILAANAGGTLLLWDAVTGAPLPAPAPDSLLSIRAARFSPDGKHIVTVGDDQVVSVIDLASGEVANAFPQPEQINALAFARGGESIVLGANDGLTYLINAGSGEEEMRLPAPSGADGASPVTALAVSGDDTLLAASADGVGVRVLNISPGPGSGREIKLLPTDGTVTDLAFSPDGRLLTAADGNRATHVWDTRSWSEVLRIPATDLITGARFSPDGTQLVVVGYDGAATAWDARSGQRIVTVRSTGSPITGVRFSRDGRRVLIAGDDGVVRVYVVNMDELLTRAQERLTALP